MIPMRLAAFLHFRIMAERKDFVHLNRLKCFNDAVFAIVSTILILPIRRLDENSGSNLETLMKDRLVELVVYFMAFLVICSVWESHVHRFKILAHADDVLIWLNLTSLMFTTFLPFGCALEGRYPKKYLPIVLICGDMLILEALEVVIILYSFRRPDLLKEHLQELPEQQLKEQRDYMLTKKLINPLLYILSASLSNTSSVTAWVLMSTVIFTPCINRFLGIVFRKFKAIRMIEPEFDLMFGNYIDTERVECFSDGVFSIVATLLVLDITTEYFPKEKDVERDGIDKAVLEMWPKFLTYVATFVIIALLWFLHHSLYHGIKKMNQIMLVANNISMSFIGFFPFVVALMNKFVADQNHLNDNTRLAVRCGAVVTYVASLAQALVLVVAMWQSHFYLEPKANPAILKSSHCYLALKLSIVPLVSLLVYFTTFAKYSALYIAFYAAVLVTPFLFLALKIALGQRDIGVMRQDILIDTDTDTWIPPPHRSRLRGQRRVLGDTNMPGSIAD